MIDLLKRHEIQVLRRAGHSLPDVSKLAGVSVRSVQRVELEPGVSHVDNVAERIRRGVGRPSKAEPFRGLVVEQLAKEPELLSLEILRRARLAGYAGGKTALYELIHSIRPRPARLVTRFEGLPGEFSQHDFGEVDVRFLDGSKQRVHFFASRLEYSRWTEVSLVEDETVESLVRALVDDFAAIGGIPLLAVFDRPKTIALSWGRDGVVTEWNSTFAAVALDLGLGDRAVLAEEPAAEGLGGEPGRVGQGVLLQATPPPGPGGPAAPASGMAPGGEHGAALEGDGCHPWGADEGGAAAPAPAQRLAGAGAVRAA
jgi:transposase